MNKSLPIGLGLVIIVGIAAWFSASSFLPPKVAVIRPIKGPAVQAVYATGTVEATVMIPISPRSSGRLVELNVDEGAEVTQGQVLGRLEDTDLQNTLKELQARLDFARQEYTRQQELVDKRVAARSALDQAKADLEAAQAAVDRMLTQIDFLKLLAPADGRVIQRDGEIGQVIPANQPVFWMSCCAPLRITAEVDEEDIFQVQPGQKVLIRADAFPGQLFNGTVQSITPKGDPVARSYRVRISLEEKSPLLIGMTAESNIIIRETNDALLIPTGAIQNNKVWIVDQNNRLHQQTVTLGAKTPQKTEITQGITLEDRIVTAPSPKLKEGQVVRTRLVAP